MLRKKLKQRLDAMDETDDWSKIDAASPVSSLRRRRSRFDDPRPCANRTRSCVIETSVVRSKTTIGACRNPGQRRGPQHLALLMPAAYMLVPGSMIAKMWFNIIFPPIEFSIVEVNSTITDYPKQQFDNVFSNLMVISTSLALGLILGFAVVQIGYQMICAFCCCKVTICAGPFATVQSRDSFHYLFQLPPAFPSPHISQSAANQTSHASGPSRRSL